jgi:hypothetical protein
MRVSSYAMPALCCFLLIPLPAATVVKAALRRTTVLRALPTTFSLCGGHFPLVHVPFGHFKPCIIRLPPWVPNSRV